VFVLTLRLRLLLSAWMVPSAARAIPVLQGRPVWNAAVVQCYGSANVTNLLLRDMRQWPEAIEPCQRSGLSNFEIMVLVKTVKEEQLEVAANAAEALRVVPRHTVMRAMSRECGCPIKCGNELTKAAEIFFTPSQETGAQYGYFGPDLPTPTMGIHKMVHQAAQRAGLCGDASRPRADYSVAVTGGSSGTANMRERLQSELHKLVPDGVTDLPNVLPIGLESAWVGGSLAALDWDTAQEPMRTANVKLGLPRWSSIC
jgi:actin-related protein